RGSCRSVVLLARPARRLGGPVSGPAAMAASVSQQVPGGNARQASAVVPPRRRTATIEGGVINIFRIFIAKSSFEPRLVGGTRTAIFEQVPLLDGLPASSSSTPCSVVLVGRA